MRVLGRCRFGGEAVPLVAQVQTGKKHARRSFWPLLHAMILTFPEVGASHQQQGADSYDRTGISPGDVVQTRVAALSPRLRPNHSTTFLTTPGLPSSTRAALDRRAARPSARGALQLVPSLDGGRKP